MIAQRFRRVVVTVDGDHHGRAALQAAARMAAWLEAELAGVFVEDRSLLDWAVLDGATVLSTISANRQRIDPAGLERALRAQGELVRRLLEAEAARCRVASSFRIERGDATSFPENPTDAADLVIVEWPQGRTKSPIGAPIGAPTRSGLARWAAAMAENRSVLVLKRPLEGPVAALFDGSSAGRHALDLAARIAARKNHDRGPADLLVMLAASNPSDLARLEAEARNGLAGRGVAPRFVGLPRVNVGRICQMIDLACVGLLVAAGDHALAPEDARALLERAAGSILLVR